MRWINALVATTGTSLARNLRGLPDPGRPMDRWLENQPEADRHTLREARTVLEKARRAVETERWETAGELLTSIPDTPRVLGAELSSLSGLLSEPAFSGVQAIHLVHSDTPEGKGCALAVAAYLMNRKGLVCHLDPVEGLQHGMESKFRVTGLRNLVSVLARIYRERGGCIALDTTAGYKAQIAIAVIFGQAFGVPVYYRFEEFRSAMEFPPLPLQFDVSLVEEFLDLFQRDVLTAEELEAIVGAPLGESNPRYARLRVLLEGPAGGSREERLWAVSPLGLLLYERWLAENQTKAAGLLPAAPRDGSATPRWGEHHRPAGVEQLVGKLLDRFPWIARIESRPAAGRSHTADGTTYRLATVQDGLPPIECTYVRDNHPAVLWIHTTARTPEQQRVALKELLLSGL